MELKDLSGSAYNFVLLLAVCRSLQIPAFIFLRTLAKRNRWGNSGEVEFQRAREFDRFLSFDGLFLQRSAPEASEGGPVLSWDVYAWFCGSAADFDLREDEQAVFPGEELKQLLSNSALATDVRDGLVYFSLSGQLRIAVSREPRVKLREAKRHLVQMVIFSLADPYIEPLWESVSLRCRDVLKSTVVPFLSHADAEELKNVLLPRQINSEVYVPELPSTSCGGLSNPPLTLHLLAFHLTNLGLNVDLINWRGLRDYLPNSPATFNLFKTLTLQFDASSEVAKFETFAEGLSACESSFLWSLVGFTIALTRRKVADSEISQCCERFAKSWLGLNKRSHSNMPTMERTSYSLVFPETPEAEALMSGFPLPVQMSLGIAYSALRYPAKAYVILRESLIARRKVSDDSYSLPSLESVLHGLLSAEMVNCANLADKSRDVQSFALSLARSRDESRLGHRFDSICVKLAATDAHIAVADYTTAEEILNQILSLADLSPYVRIVSALRLNKIWRRTDKLTAGFDDSLATIVSLTVQADLQVQTEFLAELAATLEHLRCVDKDNAYPSVMSHVVRRTIALYEKHLMLQDDWRLQRIKATYEQWSREAISSTALTEEVSTRQVAVISDNEREQPIQESIFDHFAQSKVDPRPEYFVPEGTVDRLVNYKSVMEALGMITVDSATDDIKELVSFILTRARKLFAISIYSGLEGANLYRAMRSFQDSNFQDGHLPLCIPSHGQNKPPFVRSQLWTRLKIDRFCQAQWKFLAPVFSPDHFYYDLGPETILPIINKDSDRKEGAFSQVFKVRIHEAHIKDQDRPVGTFVNALMSIGRMLTLTSQTTPAPESFALKEIRKVDNDDLAWEAEVGALYRIRTLGQPHIVRTIAAFKKGPRGAEDHYLVFEWAEGGNLRDVWVAHPKPGLSAELVKDVIRQLRGLSDALCVLHANNIRHGDLKPENILSFRSKGKGDTLLGTLKLADFGLARRHKAVTQLRDQGTTTMSGTRRYEPPEVMTEDGLARSRLYDVWAMGCIILELMIWLLYGMEGLAKFSSSMVESSSYNSSFYEVEIEHETGRRRAKVKDPVERWMDAMSRHAACAPGTAMGDLLRTLRTKLLVAQLPSTSGPLPSDPWEDARRPEIKVVHSDDSARGPYRATAAGLRDDLDIILAKEIGHDSYWATSSIESPSVEQDAAKSLVEELPSPSLSVLQVSWRRNKAFGFTFISSEGWKTTIYIGVTSRKGKGVDRPGKDMDLRLRGFDFPRQAQDKMSSQRHAHWGSAETKANAPPYGRPRIASSPRSEAAYPSTVTDLGYEAHTSLKLRPTAPSPSDHDTLAGGLQDRLFDAILFTRIPDEASSRGFLPRRQLPKLVNQRSVQEELSYVEEQWGKDAHVGGTASRSAKAIEDFARIICGVRSAAFGGTSHKRRNKSFRRIFAILVLMDRSSLIRAFVDEGVSDWDLPLARVPAIDNPAAFELRRKQALHTPLRCFGGWNHITISTFDEWQWKMIAPVFSRSAGRAISHYVLAPDVVLPFMPVEGGGVWRRGGFGRVSKTDIHADHHNFGALEMPGRVFAVKRLHSDKREDFDREVEVMRMLSHAVHPHLISLLATYEQHGTLNLIFNWADCNLMEYWRDTNSNPVVDEATVLWMAEQCRGIADGLWLISKLGVTPESHKGDQTSSPPRELSRHGDIKPENILWFSSQEGRDGRGTLKIADFSNADVHDAESGRLLAERPMVFSPTYRPPEWDVPDYTSSASHDIWALGCLYLEFITWGLGGWSLVDEFSRSRVAPDELLQIPSDCFYELTKSTVAGQVYTAAAIKPSVTQFIIRLHNLPNCTGYFHDFLDIIQKDMMIVERPEYVEGRRKSCREVFTKLATMYETCVHDTGYATKPAG